MKNKTIPLLLALCLLLSLCGCTFPAQADRAAAGDAAPEPPAPAHTQDEPAYDPQDSEDKQPKDPGAQEPDEPEEIDAPRMTACKTAVWIDGAETETYTLQEGGLYVHLGDMACAFGGSFAPDENRAVLTLWGKEIRLVGGSAFILLDGEPVRLAAPVLTDGDAWYAQASALLPALGFAELADPEFDCFYYTHIVRSGDIPAGYRIPVLMYHAVSDEIWGVSELFVSPSRLEEQLQIIRDEGYTAVTFEDLDRIDEIEKPVMLTFDDGYDDNYTELFPLLKKYGIKATIFVISDAVGYGRHMTKEQIKEMSDSGLVSIQSHTVTHGHLSEMTEEQLEREHRDSMLAIARITGKQPFVLCYPSGRSSPASRAVTAQYYEFGLNMTGPCYVTGSDPYRIWRYYIARSTDLYSFRSWIRGNP